MRSHYIAYETSTRLASGTLDLTCDIIYDMVLCFQYNAEDFLLLGSVRQHVNSQSANCINMNIFALVFGVFQLVYCYNKTHCIIYTNSLYNSSQ